MKISGHVQNWLSMAWSMSNLVDNQLNKYIFLIASDLGDPPPSPTW